MIRYALLALAFGLIAVPNVFADVTADVLDFDPSVCASTPWPAAAGIQEAVAEAESAECLAMMTAFPQPELERVPIDRLHLNEYSFWRVGPDAINLYHAPGGPVMGQMPAGFNFVRAVNTDVEGWIQREGGEWLLRADARPVNPSSFAGMLLPEDWTHPFAVILDKTGIYASLRPGVKGSSESGYVTRRYRLVNIFVRAEDDEGKVWYLIGPQRWIRQEYVAMFTPVARPAEVTGRWVAVDLFEQTLIAHEDDRPVFATVISSGLPDWSTPEGIYKIWARLTSDSMSGATGAPDAYALQHVPWVMYFKGGISLHGTYWHDGFGYRRSHGCVNLSISDSRWLYEWTADTEPDAEGEIVNMVYIYSSAEYARG